LTEPHLTDGGFTFPIDGWNEGLRDLCSRYGTLLLIDETHTQTAGPGGLTRQWGLSPDLFISGKCIAAGLPVGVIGMSEAIAERYEALLNDGDPSAMGGCMGQGTTNSANALCVKALRLSLEYNFSEETFAKMNASMDTIERGDHRQARRPVSHRSFRGPNERLLPARQGLRREIRTAEHRLRWSARILDLLLSQPRGPLHPLL
jgi:glutamate-1-semialdehyde aminotransferase